MGHDYIPRPMRRVLAIVAVAAASLCGASSAAAPPASIAALGDSITRAFNAGRIPFRDASSYSWATGTQVSSQARRLRVRLTYNDAKDGARMRDLPGQATRAADQQADHVLILMGANDICHGGVASMTSVARFRSDFESGLRVLATRLPDARVEVLSIPDLTRLWQIEKGRFLARTAWRFLHTCDALLERPQSNAAEDVARRALVRNRLIGFNRVLGEACAQYALCSYDGGAVFRTRFDRGDISSRDFFHPSRDGQEALAKVAWDTGFTAP